MKGDKIPEKDHISRYCAPKTIEGGEIQASAFILRERDVYLSVNWLEYFNCPTRESEIEEVRKVYFSKLTIKAKAKIAVLNVGEICDKVRTETPDKRNLNILHKPDDDDPTHSGIYNMRPDNEIIAELIRKTVRESYSAR